MSMDDENKVTDGDVTPVVRRRRSAPVRKPEGMPDSDLQVTDDKPKRPSIDDVKDIGGMVEKRWSGLPMWQCPKCNGTTFDEAQSRVHQCKRIKYAGEEGLED